jgi:hypothetical protein
MEFLAVVDRIEGEVAVLTPLEGAKAGSATGGRFLWPKRLLPEAVREGDILQVTAKIAKDAGSSTRERVKGLLDSLRSSSGGKDPRVGGGDHR